MNTKQKQPGRFFNYVADLGELFVFGKNAQFQTPHLFPEDQKKRKPFFDFFADIGEYFVPASSKEAEPVPPESAGLQTSGIRMDTNPASQDNGAGEMVSEQRPKITHLIFPLINFVSEVDRIELSESATIRKVEAWSKGTQSQPFPTTHLIEVRLPEPVAELGECRETFETSTLILKLFKKELIYAPNYWGQTGKEKGLNTQESFWIRYYTPWGGSAPYHLLETEVENLKAHWDSFQHISWKNIAGSRYSSSDYRPQAIDRIVDYAIGLEFLFVPQEKADISYKLKMRGTRILHSEITEPSDLIYTHLDTLYKWRSSIVHGDKPRGTIKQIMESEDRMWDFARDIRNYLRIAICYFHRENQLENNESRKKFLQDVVDKNIAGVS